MAGARPLASEDAGVLQPLLDAAAKQGDVVAIRVVCAAGADPNAATGSGITALYLAAREKRVDSIDILLVLGAHPPCRGIRAAPLSPLLQAAAETGDIQSVRILLTAVADPASTDTKGHTALYRAAKGRHASVIVALLDAGADAGFPVAQRRNGRRQPSWPPPFSTRASTPAASMIEALPRFTWPQAKAMSISSPLCSTLAPGRMHSPATASRRCTSPRAPDGPGSSACCSAPEPTRASLMAMDVLRSTLRSKRGTAM